MPQRTSSPLIPAAPALCLLLFAGLTTAAHAQKVQPQPVTDSSAQASPLTPVPHAPVDDNSAQASSISAERRRTGPHLAPHTAVSVALGRAIDSGKLKQGDTVTARLTAPIAAPGSHTLPAGTPVMLSVIETVPAGRISAVGEFSLQAVQVGNIGVYTDTLVFQGKPGHQDLPDSAPALGTDAGLPSGAPLTFQVQPPPVDADYLPPPSDKNTGNTPGAVNGIASGSPPPASAMKSTYGDANGAGSGKTPAQRQPSISPGDTTTGQQPQQAQQPSVASNQPQSPSQTSPNPGKPQ